MVIDNTIDVNETVFHCTQPERKRKGISKQITPNFGDKGTK